MNWYLWFLAGWFLLNALVTVAKVGKPEKATSPGVAAIVVLIQALLIAGLFAFGAK